MIESELLRGELTRTILTGEIVAEINVLSRELQAGGTPWSHVAFKAHDTRELEARLRASSARGVVVLQNFDFPLEPQDKGFLPGDELHWLITGIQD